MLKGATLLKFIRLLTEKKPTTVHWSIK